MADAGNVLLHSRSFRVHSPANSLIVSALAERVSEWVYWTDPLKDNPFVIRDEKAIEMEEKNWILQMHLNNADGFEYCLYF